MLASDDRVPSGARSLTVKGEKKKEMKILETIDSSRRRTELYHADTPLPGGGQQDSI